MNLYLNDRAERTIAHALDCVGLFAFSAVTGGIVALLCDVRLNYDPRVDIIFGAIAALFPAIIVWSKRTLLELEESARKWEQMKIDAQMRATEEREQADRTYRLRLLELEQKHEHDLWDARNEYMRLSIERQLLSKS